MKVTHHCKVTNRSEPLFFIPLQSYSPKSIEVSYKCQKCDQTITISGDKYTRNHPSRSKIQARFEKR